LLPGNVPLDAASLLGSYHLQHQARALQNQGVAPLYTSTINLQLRKDGRYRLDYLVSTPTRLPSDPSYKGIQVAEQGGFSLSNAILLLEPQTTEITRVRNGGIADPKEVIGNERRVYVIRVRTVVRNQSVKNTVAINLVGRCASYQLEPVCSQSKNVWYSFLEVITQAGTGWQRGAMMARESRATSTFATC